MKSSDSGDVVSSFTCELPVCEWGGGRKLVFELAQKGGREAKGTPTVAKYLVSCPIDCGGNNNLRFDKDHIPVAIKHMLVAFLI